MSRFFLSADARVDLQELSEYLDSIQPEAALRIATAVQRMLLGIANNPYLGSSHSSLTQLLGIEIRSRLVDPYRIFYSVLRSSPEIIAILHTSRDVKAILAERFQ